MIKTLKGLLTVAAKKDIRFYLNGIHVVCDSAGVVKLEASDGSTGMILTITSGMFNVAPDTDVILCRVSLDNAIKMFGPKAAPTFTINNELARIGEYNVNLIDGRYPDLSRAMRLNDDSAFVGDEIGLNFTLLGKLCKACELVLHGHTFIAGLFKFRDASTSLLISRKFNDDKDLLQVAIMPTRM